MPETPNRHSLRVRAQQVNGAPSLKALIQVSVSSCGNSASGGGFLGHRDRGHVNRATNDSLNRQPGLTDPPKKQGEKPSLPSYCDRLLVSVQAPVPTAQPEAAGSEM